MEAIEIGDFTRPEWIGETDVSGRDKFIRVLHGLILRYRGKNFIVLNNAGPDELPIHVAHLGREN